MRFGKGKRTEGGGRRRDSWRVGGGRLEGEVVRRKEGGWRDGERRAEVGRKREGGLKKEGGRREEDRWMRMEEGRRIEGGRMREEGRRGVGGRRREAGGRRTWTYSADNTVATHLFQRLVSA